MGDLVFMKEYTQLFDCKDMQEQTTIKICEEICKGIEHCKTYQSVRKRIREEALNNKRK